MVLFLQRRATYNLQFLALVQHTTSTSHIKNLTSYQVEEKSTENDERKKFLLGLNDEHTRICELFAMRDSTAIEKYLVDVHWNPAEAVYEVLG